MRYWSNYENRRHNGQGDLKYLYQSPATIWQVHGTRTTDQRQRHSSEDRRAKRRHLFAPQANRQLSRGRATATTIAAKLGNAHCSVIKRTPTHTDQRPVPRNTLSGHGARRESDLPLPCKTRAHSGTSPGATANSRNYQWSFDRRAWPRRPLCQQQLQYLTKEG